MICRHKCWRWGNRTALDWICQNQSHLPSDHSKCSIPQSLCFHFHSCSSEAKNLTLRHYIDPSCPPCLASSASCLIHISSQSPSDHWSGSPTNPLESKHPSWSFASSDTSLLLWSLCIDSVSWSWSCCLLLFGCIRGRCRYLFASRIFWRFQTESCHSTARGALGRCRRCCRMRDASALLGSLRCLLALFVFRRGLTWPSRNWIWFASIAPWGLQGQI